MDGNHNFDALRRAAEVALEAQEALQAAWRQWSSLGSPSLTPEDVRLLKTLIVSRIYPINAFGLLVAADPLGAMEMLLSRYVGRGVDPDRKFGGYVFELSSMLTDLVESQGESRLRQLLEHPSFNKALLTDERVISSIGEALGMERPETQNWIQSTQL